MKILVVDDSDSMTDLLRIVLEDEGYEVLSCDDGEAGLRLVREHRPDLLIVDLRMPKVDGWSMIDAIRLDANLGDLPVIVCSASRDMVEARRESLPEACAVFEKPFNMDKLLAAIRTLSSHRIPVAAGEYAPNASWT